MSISAAYRDTGVSGKAIAVIGSQWGLHCALDKEESAYRNELCYWTRKLADIIYITKTVTEIQVHQGTSIIGNLFSCRDNHIACTVNPTLHK